MYGDGMSHSVMGGREERGSPEYLPRDSPDPEGDAHNTHEDTKEADCGKPGSRGPCHWWQVDFLIGSYSKVGPRDSPMDAQDTMTGRIELFDEG